MNQTKEAPQTTEPTEQGNGEEKSTLSWFREMPSKVKRGGAVIVVGAVAVGAYGLGRASNSPESSPPNQPVATAPAEPSPTPESTPMGAGATEQPATAATQSTQELVLKGTEPKPETTEDWLNLWEKEQGLVNGYTIAETSGHEFVDAVKSDWLSDLAAIEHAESEAEASNFTERQLLTGVSFIIETFDGFTVVKNPIIYGVETNAEGGAENYSKRANHQESSYQTFSLLYMNDEGEWHHLMMNQNNVSLFSEDGARLIGMFMEPEQTQMTIVPTQIQAETVQGGSDKFIAKDISASVETASKPYAVKPSQKFAEVGEALSALEDQGLRPVSMVDTLNAGPEKRHM